MKLSEKDKKILMILAILGVLVLPYSIIVTPLTDAAFKVKDELLKLESEYTELSTMHANKDVYVETMEKLQMQEEELLAQFPEDLAQEATIMFIVDVENVTGVSLYQIALGDDIAAQIVSEEEEAQIDAVEQELGDVTDDTYIVDNTVTTEVGKYSALSTTTQFSFRSTYEQFKQFINYIKQFEDRMVVTDLTASYTKETDTVNGSFSLVQYAITGEDRIFPETVVGLDLGTENIFKEAAGTTAAGEEDMGTYDFFMMLTNPKASVDVKTIGRANDAAKQSYLVSNENRRETMTITFTGSEGNYAASYAIGNQQFPAEDYEEGIAFTPGDRLDLQIMGYERNDENDNVEADVNIINKTDMTLYVDVTEEAPNKPRVTIMEKTGDIVVN